MTDARVDPVAGQYLLRTDGKGRVVYFRVKRTFNGKPYATQPGGPHVAAHLVLSPVDEDKPVRERVYSLRDWRAMMVKAEVPPFHTPGEVSVVFEKVERRLARRDA